MTTGAATSRLKQALWQVPLLLVLAGALALGVNALRTDGLPLVGDWSAQARFADQAGDSLTIDLDQARRLFEADAALFVDARPESQYAEGHIQGALCLPWQYVDDHIMDAYERLLATDRTIITYCDGESCDLSHELALLLKDLGMKNVRVLVNGWSVWREAGLPTTEEQR
jgi:rhodanese-related sulfurtransferase